MRIHTDLTAEQVAGQAALITPRQTTKSHTEVHPVAVHSISEHRSTARARALEVQLSGNSFGGACATRKPGLDPAPGGSATWDETGAVLARLYALDPQMVVGSPGTPVYRDADDFHELTAGRFRDGDVPADTHRRHDWTSSSPTRTSRGESGWMRMCGTCLTTSTTVERRKRALR